MANLIVIPESAVLAPPIANISLADALTFHIPISHVPPMYTRFFSLGDIEDVMWGKSAGVIPNPVKTIAP